MRRAWTATTGVLTILALAVSGCGSADEAATASGTGTSTGAVINVVTSTNVWAAVVTAVGGDLVSVTSVLDDPSADPHSFEASPRVKLAMSEATLVVVNGGGYDDWAIDTVESLDPQPTTVNAVDASGLPVSEDFNEHVFYDPPVVAAIATRIADELSTIDASNAATYRANAAAFATAVGGLQTSITAIAADHPGISVVATEPVVGYLVSELGFTDVTPAGFSAAIEAESEVSVRDLNDAETLLTDGTATLLFHNEQTSDQVTDQLVSAAEGAGVGVVGVTETLPAGVTDYVAWIQGTLAAITAALDRR